MFDSSAQQTLAVLLNIILLLGRWCAGLQPPTICAKSYMAYNAFRRYYRIKLQNGALLAANALFT
jgi:hypothetical protein